MSQLPTVTKDSHHSQHTTCFCLQLVCVHVGDLYACTSVNFSVANTMNVCVCMCIQAEHERIHFLGVPVIITEHVHGVY